MKIMLVDIAEILRTFLAFPFFLVAITLRFVTLAFDYMAIIVGGENIAKAVLKLYK